MRRQWRNAHATFEIWYGLGTASGTLAGWDWFGHSGGLQGYISRTAVAPEQGLPISVLTNSISGLAWLWLDGLLHILRTFAQRGAPSEALRGWTGRWWTPWGATDLVSAGEGVLLASPMLFNSFMASFEIEVTGPDQGRVVLANGYNSHVEPVCLARNADGDICEFWSPGRDRCRRRRSRRTCAGATPRRRAAPLIAVGVSKSVSEARHRRERPGRNSRS